MQYVQSEDLCAMDLIQSVKSVLFTVYTVFRFFLIAQSRCMPVGCVHACVCVMSLLSFIY